MIKTSVLDANAVLDLIEAGPGFVKVEQLLQAALRNDAAVLMSVLNMGEVFYLLWQRRGEEKARQTIPNLSRLPIQIVIVDFPQAIQAGELKAPQYTLRGLCHGRLDLPATGHTGNFRPRLREAGAPLSNFVDRSLLIRRLVEC